MYLIISDLLKHCRGDLTRTDDPLHPMQVQEWRMLSLKAEDKRLFYNYLRRIKHP